MAANIPSLFTRREATSIHALAPAPSVDIELQAVALLPGYERVIEPLR